MGFKTGMKNKISKEKKSVDLIPCSICGKDAYIHKSRGPFVLMHNCLLYGDIQSIVEQWNKNNKQEGANEE